MKEMFLTGYEKENIEEFVDKVKSRNVTTVVDVRESPVSRKKGFSKNALDSKLKRVGIGYVHMRELGSPKEIRCKLRAKEINYLDFFKSYRLYIKGRHIELKKILDLVESETICIMCFERNCELCHRSIVADELQKLNPRLKFLPI